MTLGLFFTRGISLETWVKSGIFCREKLIYERHLEKYTFNKIYWFTYGVNDTALSADLKASGRLHQSIFVIQKPKCFCFPCIGNLVYLICLPFLHKELVSKCDIVKSNQMDGSWAAVLSKILYRKQLMVRTGFTLSLVMRKKKQWLMYYLARLIEQVSVMFADAVVVSSDYDKRYIESLYRVSHKLFVIPNYVDMTKFIFVQDKSFVKNRIVFVGRLSDQKNLYNLLDSIESTSIKLDLYGDGALRDDLEKYVIGRDICAKFFGSVPNSDLPGVFQKYDFYVLPSLYEGMPKSLLEAMSCGLVCIGTDISGINEVIRHRYNGFLSGDNSALSIRTSIREAVNSDYNQIQQIRNNAVSTIRNKFSLDIIEQEEIRVFRV